jgi:dTDP-4-dehydrorhamnose reductase
VRIWVVGAHGMLGRAVMHACRARDIDAIGTDRELDITNERAVHDFGVREQFTHVINCAAYTAVDDCESHEAEALAVNATGAANVARVASACGAISTYISTDYVFDGTKGEPYVEEDEPCPINAYGRTKLAGERAHLALAPDGYVVRTSWMFGDGKNFISTMIRLFRERDEVRVVDDQHGRPTYASDLAKVLVAMAIHPPTPGIYHMSNIGAVVSWFDLARATLEMLGPYRCLQTTLVPITSAEYVTPAKRPAYSVLSTDRIQQALAAMPGPVWLDVWQLALSDFLTP